MDEWKDDIEKYISGKLTPAERHALEKKALSDPFLADALEGAENLPDTFSIDVAELNQKIIGAGQSRWLWPLRIAASVVGIAIVSTAIFYSVKEDQTQLASNKKPTETSSGEENKAVAKDTIADKEAVEKNTSASQKLHEKPKIEELIASQNRKESKGEAGPKTSKEALSSKQLATAKPSETKIDSFTHSGLSGGSLMASQLTTDTVALFEAEMADNAVTSAPVAQPIVEKIESKVTQAKKSQRERATATPPRAENLMVSGVVRDQQGQPIPGVNILAQGTSIGTITNAEGKYSIAVPQPDQVLVYSFIGYVSQQQPIDKANVTDLNIQLQEDATQLSEVVVTGYGERNANASTEPVVRLAEPVGGRKAYDKYLEEKKVYPQQALENKVEGKVVIEFTVGVTGALSDFNVVRKLGYGCEEEVIRLVKGGPHWKPSYIDNEAVESLVRIKTRFSLPGK